MIRSFFKEAPLVSPIFHSPKMDVVYEAIVIGAGVEGSSTAYNIVNNGAKQVALVEQFQLGHSRGSSHGGSRIIRRGYHARHYVEMMREAFKLWERIEEESGTQLYVKTGGLHFAHATSKDLKEIIGGFQQYNINYEELSSTEANERFVFFNLPPDYKCVIEEDAGILAASRAVDAIQTLFIKRGGKIFDCCKVTNIIPDGDTVTIATSRGDFKTKKLVITAGSWADKLLRPLGLELPLTVMKIDVAYWQLDDHLLDISTATSDGGHHSNHCSLGVFILWDGVHYGGLPPYEYPGLVKICYHQGNLVDPDHRDAEPTAQCLPKVSEFIEKHFKGISTTPSIVESCLYTMTPDQDFFLDHHPQHHNIIIGAGFSGHGFKLAPVVGKILSELTMDLPPSYDLQSFKLDRFRTS